MQISSNALIGALSQARGSSLTTKVKSAEDQLAEKLAAIEPGGPAKSTAPEVLAAAPVSASNETARTLFYAQQAASDVPAVEPKINEAVETFLEYMDKTPTERWREQILSSMGLTEESLEALTPEERRAVEEKIVQIIEEKTKENARGNEAESQTQTLEKDVAASASQSEAPAPQSANVNSLQKLSPTIVQMLDLPAEAYHTHMEAMQKFEEYEKRERLNVSANDVAPKSRFDDVE